MAEETVVETPVAAEAAPVTAETPVTPVETPVETPAVDPNDPMAALEAAMKAELGEEEPVADPKAVAEAQENAIPEQFQAALNISPFVNSPETLQQAVAAADEVWKVATGQLPARQMLEGFKDTNPAQYQAIVKDLSEYLGVQAQPQASPLADLKASNPEAYAQVAQFIQQVTGKPLEGPVDPRDARLAAIEQKYAAEEQQRQQVIMQQQIKAADEKAYAFLGEKLKGTFAEGMEEHFINLMARHIGDPAKAMQEALAGDTKTLEKALKTVQKSEVERLKAYNANLIKKHRALANATPAVKGAAPTTPAANKTAPARKEGESDINYAKRLWDSGFNA